MNRIALTILVVFISTQVNASSPSVTDASKVVIEGSGVSITTLDLEAELKRSTPQLRNGLLGKPDAIAQLATNLLVRRALARQAEQGMLLAVPLNQAQVQLARDRALSEIKLLQVDEQSKPSAEQLDVLAREVYNTDESRFSVQEQVKASHILLLGTDADAEVKAGKLLETLKAGADFSELAKVNSQDPGSASKGGDLGYFSRGRMVKEFDDAVFKLQIDQLSQVVKTQFGFHIIKLIDRKPAGRVPYEEVRQQLMNEQAAKVINDVRFRLAEKIIGSAKASPEVLEAFIAKQKQ